MRDTDGHKTIRMLTQRGGPRNGTIDGRAARARTVRDTTSFRRNRRSSGASLNSIHLTGRRKSRLPDPKPPLRFWRLRSRVVYPRS